MKHAGLFPLARATVLSLTLAPLALVGCGATPAPSQAPIAGQDAAPAKRAEKRLVVFVVDRSGSMTGAKLDQAKRGVVEAARAVDEHTTVEAVFYDSAAFHAGSLRAGGDPDRFAAEVERVQAGGGTDPLPALEIAARLVDGHDGARHVVLLTDGQFPTRGLDDLVSRIRRAGGTFSTIGLGQDVDAALLQRAAKEGGGSYGHTTDPAELRKLLREEATR